MKIYNKPANLNGAELKEELAAVGIIVDEVYDFGNDTIGLETNDEAKATSVVAAHNGTTVAPEPTIANKLASVGLSLDELKSAILGGN
jgi:hypothetical protein